MSVIKPRVARVQQPNQSAPLHIKWRPSKLGDVIGQESTVVNIERLFEARRVPHTFLFTGPSGTGKTTLARILAGMLEAQLIEVDAARYSGIDQMRGLIDGAQYSSLSDSRRKFVVIDEAHALSKAAWQTLLLTTEEPPDHLYVALCTTEPDKVPKTIRTRSHAYDLKPVKWDELADYLDYVNKEDNLKVKSEFIELAARKADGSVRQGLVFLSKLDGITDRKLAQQLVEEIDEQSEGPVALARMIVSGKNFNWQSVRKLLEGMSDIPPETIRLVVLNYVLAVLMNEDGPTEAMRLLAVLQAFSTPCPPAEKMAPIFLAVGTLLQG